MTNTFYSPGDQRATKVNELFSVIARRYDFINDVQSFGLHRTWKRRVVKLATVRSGNAALDVCCGTGDIAFALARAGAEVVGVDFNSQMLAVAADRNRKFDGGTPPKFTQGDAQKLGFTDGTFDVATVGYGLRNLADWRLGLREMHRVLKPGGRLVVLEFGKPDNRLWRTMYFLYLRVFVPLVGLVFCRNAGAYAYILESLHHFPAQRGIESEMQQLGMRAVRTVNILGGVMGINVGTKA